MSSTTRRVLPGDTEPLAPPAAGLRWLLPGARVQAARWGHGAAAQCAHTRCARSRASFSVVGFIFQLAAMNGRRRDVAAGGARWTAAEAAHASRSVRTPKNPIPRILGASMTRTTLAEFCCDVYNRKKSGARGQSIDETGPQPSYNLVRNRPLVR